jgi:RimJ/RimL family protein N-acetyltransferase
MRTNLRIDTNGKKIDIRDLSKRHSPELITRYINRLIGENTFILIDKKVTLAKEKEWLSSKLSSCAKGDSICLVAEHEGRICGIINADREPFKMRDNVVIGIAFLLEFRGQGLGGICLREIIHRVKKEMKPKNIHLRVFSTNKAGIRLYEKAGFRKIALLPKWAKHRGKYVDEYIMLFLPRLKDSPQFSGKLVP